MLLEKTVRNLVLSGVLKEQERDLVDDLKCLDVSDPILETAGEWISATVEV